MKYIAVKNWETFQHYDPAKRAPKWIKAYTDLLDASKHPTFTDLSDAAKLTLHHIRLLAATCGNRIPVQWLNADRLNMATPRVRELIAAGFVIDADMLANVTPFDSTNQQSPASKSGISEGLNGLHSVLNYELEFNSIWQTVLETKVPKPVHKSAAYRHFCSSVRKPEDLSLLRAALMNYKKSERVKKGFIQDASTWFNNWRDWATFDERETKPIDRGSGVSGKVESSKGRVWHERRLAPSGSPSGNQENGPVLPVQEPSPRGSNGNL